MSPRGQRHTPTCCPANIEHGFVLATAVHMGASDGFLYGSLWQTRLVDAVGVMHVIETAKCPACGTVLYGMPHVTVNAWSGIAAETAQNEVDEAVRKVREAQAALTRAAEKK